MAATSATEKEIEKAKACGDDGSKPIQADKAPYRPKEKSTYFEPTYFPDDEDMLEEVLNTNGTLWKHKARVGPRDPNSIIRFDEEKHAAEFAARIQWRDCPLDQRPRFEATVKKYWDAFALEGVSKPIRGFQCVINTGNSPPITCKTPRYGPHEERVINKLVRELEARDMIEDCESPWGSQVVLAAKPNQDHKHWSEFVWRLCVSYRKVNAVVRPFVYPARRCDDAIRDIGKSKFFITLDLEMGYWQILLHILSRDILAFFVPGGKKRWKRMPMGFINAHGIFCAMVDYLRRETNILVEERGITLNYDVTLEGDKPWTNQEGIVDDVFIHSECNETMHKYFEVFLEVCVRHQVTINLKKTRFLPQSAEFVGVDVEADGNRPAQSKMGQVDKLKRKYGAIEDLQERPPIGVGDVRSLIGMLGFYQEYMPNLELRMAPFRAVIKKKLDQASNNKGKRQTKYGAPFGSDLLLGDDWTPELQALAEELLEELKTRPTLARPDYTRRFYLKTDWSRFGKAAVLLQADPDDQAAREAEEAETKGGPCLFDGAASKFRLRPIAFISAKCTKSEADDHSFTGEAATGGWAIEKFRRQLFGKEFTWITDCSGLRQFFDGYDVPTHAHQRLRQRLLRYAFTVVHRSARFLVECDVLSRYNGFTAELKEKHDQARASEVETEKEETTEIQEFGRQLTRLNQEPIIEAPAVNSSIIRNMSFSVRPKQTAQHQTVAAYTPMLRNANLDRTCWILNAGTSTMMAGAREAGIELHPLLIENRPEWRFKADPSTWNTGDSEDLLTNVELTNVCSKPDQDRSSPDWILAHLDSDSSDDSVEELIQGLTNVKRTRCIMIFVSVRGSSREQQVLQVEQQLKRMRMHVTRKRVEATDSGAPINGLFTVIMATDSQATLDVLHIAQETSAPMAEWLDSPNKDSGADFILYPRQQRAPTQLEQTHEQAHIEVMSIMDERRSDWTPAFDTGRPAPSLSDSTTEWDGSPFLICVNDDILQRGIRRIRHQEVLRLIGVEGDPGARLVNSKRQHSWDELRQLPPKQLVARMFEAVLRAEERTRIKDEPNPEVHLMIANALNLATTLPLPNRAAWQLATAQDPDLAYLEHCLRNDEIPEQDNFLDKAWYLEWKAKRLEASDGIVYRYETAKLVGLRVIRAQTVPRRMRQLVFSALHVSPAGGHSGFHKTYWKIAVRFFWPRMATDVRQMQMGCGHCRVVNNASHEAQQALRTVMSDAPFDVIVLDIWHPGKSAATKTKTAHVLVSLDLLTAFAMGQFVQSLDSSHIATTMFASCFSVTGLPKLVIIDAGSEFAGTLRQLCQSLSIRHHTVARGNHKAILVERFNRYMNKAQRLHAANCETFQEWQLGTAFALYGWNSTPVDGTNVIRSYAAIGREFPFPIDIETEPQAERDHQAQGQAVIDHVDATFPMLAKQRELLKILTTERREHHRNLKNEGRNATKFYPGEIVMIRKEVQSSDVKGPAKARIRARGCYRVIEEEKPGSYFVQRIPFTARNRRGRNKPLKESAARMERVPTTLVIHKATDGMDTRLATIHRPLVTNPLENTLGPAQFGTYRQAPATQAYAFERIEDIWGEDDLGQSDSDSESSEDSEGGPDEEDGPDADDIAEPMENSEGGSDEEDGPDADNTDAPMGVDETIARPITTARRRRSTRNVAQGTAALPNDGENPEGEADSNLRRSKRAKRIPPGLGIYKHRAKSTNTRAQRNHALLQAIRESRDKMIIIDYREPGDTRSQWYAAQVLMRESEQRADIEKGYYIVRLWIRHAKDSQTRTKRACRYWPEVHYKRPNGTMGAIAMVRPSKTDRILQQVQKYTARDEQFNLDKYLMVGPFDFGIPREYDDQPNRIPDEIWIDMAHQAERRNINAADINEVVPLTASTTR